eukprot:scaffold162_cov60-Cylindrotheca_fusiformis.AAC.1
MADLQVWDHLLLAWKDENGTEIPNVREEFDVKRIQEDGDDSCPYTAQYQLIIRQEKSDDWILISLDKNGIRKTIGGDEMYVLYYHHHHDNNNNNNQMNATAAVAYSIDQGDGSYLLKFHWTPYYSTTTSEGITDTSNNNFGGQLVIHLQYTCGLGTLHHPKKKLWRTGGYLMRTYRRQ